MRGEFIGVWSETWREIWFPIISQPWDGDNDGVPDDTFCELYRALVPALSRNPSIEDLAGIIDDPLKGLDAFQSTKVDDLAGERALVGFFESAHEALEGLGGDGLSNHYFNLLERFIEKYSLRYDLRRPCTLCPTLPGLMTSLAQHMRSASQVDAHLAKLNLEFEDAVRDLRHGRTEGRIKSCLSKQYILIEGIANTCSGTSGETLGKRCNQASWPHLTLKTAAGNIYGFRSDYPGLGHAGNSNAVMRDVDDRELVGVSCMLLGVLPYVDPTMDLDSVYGGSMAPIRRGIDGQAAGPIASPSTTIWRQFWSWATKLLFRR